jgi:ribosomal-protein-alanine N-acetyltransferase
MGTSSFQLPLLRTDRLILRAPDERDIPAWFARATDREAALMAGDAAPDGPAAGDAWLARSRLQTEAGTRLQWAIDCAGVGESIGTISLSLSDPAVGFVLGRPYWGRGLATEAARAVARHGFGRLGLKEIFAEVVARNAASIRVLEKLGFLKIATYADPADGEMCERFVLRGGRSVAL